MHDELHDVILYARIAWMLSVICWAEPVDLWSVICYLLSGTGTYGKQVM